MPTNYFALGILIAFSSCLTDVTCLRHGHTQTTSVKPTLHRQKCYGNYCPGGIKMNAVCKGGYCVCTGQDYGYYTCLPNAYGCRIDVNADKSLAKPQYNNRQPGSIYSCTPATSSKNYEVHVLAVYEGNRHTRPPSAGDTNVNIIRRGKSNRPIILVLGSYEPVNWILNLPAGVKISRVILVAYYIDQSSVSGDVNQVQAFERQGSRSSQWSSGNGQDLGGGDTVGLLRQVHNRFGVVTSFTGTYKADLWSLTLSSTQGLGLTSTVVTTQATTTPPPPIPTTTPKPTVSQQKCFGSSNYCPGKYEALKAVCKAGYCFCTGQDYDYTTCLPNAYGCRIDVNADKSLAKPQYNNRQPGSIYSCTPASSSKNYEVHVLAVYEGNRHTRPPSAGDTNVNVVRRGKSNRPIILVLGSNEPVNWILNLPAGVKISRVILVAHYIAQSSVTGDVKQVQAVERMSRQWGMGFGSDSGGGNTVALLRQVHSRFGVVTSFTGTYKADQWSLTLSSTQGHGHPQTTSVKPTLHRQKCYGNYCPGGIKMNAVCKGGYCVCTGQDYGYYTCLPNAYGCRIEVNADKSLAKPQYNNRQPGSIYSCTPASSSTNYEVHVLAVYEGNRHTRPPSAGDTNVNIVRRGKSNRPIILVLGSYEPVNWILNLPAGVKISRVILVAYYIDQSSVSGDVNQVQAFERQGTRSSQWSSGNGQDSGGGDTVGLLRQVHNRFGVVTSFTGTYKADLWSLTLSSTQGLGLTSTVVTTQATTTPPPPIPTTTPKPTVSQQKCLGSSNYCPGKYEALKAVCKAGYCFCTGQGYDYTTCLPNAYGCRIEVNADKSLAKPQYNNRQPGLTYSCTPASSSKNYEVHVLAVYEGNRHTRPPSAGDTNVNVVRRGISNRPIILVLGSYEPVNWILNLPAGVTISRVILVAYYMAQSSVTGDVNQVQAVERKSRQWDMGYGSDSGGGNTAALLRQVHSRFGVVTSFTGTYKADQWSLTLSSSQGLGLTSTVVTTQATTTPPPPIPTTTPKPTVSQQKCFGSSNYCPGKYEALKAVCKAGYCFCTGQDYNYTTCLPHAYGCRIEVNTDKSLAKPQYNNRQPGSIYSCTPATSSKNYEVHVLAVYEVINRRPPSAGDATVNIVSRGRSDRPIILVLGSYEPVNWILNLPAGVKISRVILVAYYIDQSSVSGDVNQVQAFERQGSRSSQWSSGNGQDLGGGDTVGLLRQVHNRFGVVTSFTGTNKADQWSLTLSSSQGLGLTSTVVTTQATTTPPPPIPTITPKPTVSQQKCFGSSNYCHGKYGAMKAVCKGGYCFCTGQDYDYTTCLPNAYGCRIELVNTDKSLAKPQYNNRQPGSIYSCTPASSSKNYEVHVLAVYEGNRHTRPPSAGDTNVNIVRRGKSNRPVILVLGSYEPVNWILNLPAGITISKVILVAYYIAQSSVTGDVNQVQAVERKSRQWGIGFGTDSGGGNTVALLRQVHSRFGVVTSFTGTYKADQWSLTLSSTQGHGNTQTTTPSPPIPTTTVKPTLHRKKCYWNYCSSGYNMNAVCKGGYCVCTGHNYGYYTCLPDAYGCKIFANTDTALAKPRYKKQQRQTIYSCTPKNSSTRYEVHVLAVNEVINRRPPSAGDATINIVSRGRSHKPVILVLGSYEPVNWIVKVPVEITISKVILVAYYVDKSSVSGDLERVNTTERHSWQWGMGYGSDAGGGDTVALLRQVHKRFGVVTSFTGTYRADEWSLELSSPQGQNGAPCQSIVFYLHITVIVLLSIPLLSL